MTRAPFAHPATVETVETAGCLEPAAALARRHNPRGVRLHHLQQHRQAVKLAVERAQHAILHLPVHVETEQEVRRGWSGRGEVLEEDVEDEGPGAGDDVGEGVVGRRRIRTRDRRVPDRRRCQRRQLQHARAAPHQPDAGVPREQVDEPRRPTGNLGENLERRERQRGVVAVRDVPDRRRALGRVAEHHLVER